MYITQLFKHWTYQVFAPGTLIRRKYEAFKSLLTYDGICLELIADLEETYHQDAYADWTRAAWLAERLRKNTGKLIDELFKLSPTKYLGLIDYYKKIGFYISMGVELPVPEASPPWILPLADAADFPLDAGGKAINLARLKQDGRFNVPDSFVITTGCFNYFLDSNGLREQLDKRLRRIRLCEPERLKELCEEMQDLILSGEVPGPVHEALEQGIAEMGESVNAFAFRSSAVAEDSKTSFAGQYDSVLNVSRNEVNEAYKKVLASKYSPKAVSYRILQGLPDDMAPMAVLVMPMVDTISAGVAYSFDPDEIDNGKDCCLNIFAVPGSGEKLVGGRKAPHLFRYARTNGLRYISGPDQSVWQLPGAEHMRTVAETTMALERFFGNPQDVEWGLDKNGNLHILQSRPLLNEDQHSTPPDFPDEDPILNGGIKAAAGVAHGTVHHVANPEEARDIPDGVVAVVETLAPELAILAQKAVAVVAQTGSRASHFASVARELGIPVMVNCPGAFNDLKEGDEVTVHANSGTVWTGKKEGLLECAPAKNRDEQTMLRKRLDRIMPYVAELNLTDPSSESFSPEHCRTIHDIVRFCHEKGVSEMFSLVDKDTRGLSKAKRLKTSLPLAFYLLDLEDGLFPAAKSKKIITDDDIKSEPFWSIWFGLNSPDIVWDSSVFHTDWETTDKHSAGIISPDSVQYSSYAVISASYLHVMMRFGYHFSVVDAYCGDETSHNYIKFRFKGGGADFDKRILRLEFISNVLRRFGFTVSVKGDLLDARHTAASHTTIQKRLALLGKLMARTKLMDMSMETPDQVSDLVEEFINSLGH